MRRIYEVAREPATPAQSYGRRERRNLEALLHRAAHLRERTRGRSDLHFDLAELAAIVWAVQVVENARGPLPEDLEQLRATIC